MPRLNLATLVATALLAASAVTVSPIAQAQEQKITTKEVAKPMQTALDAINKKQWDKALASLKQAQAVPKKTPFEAFKIDEFLGFVLLNMKREGEAAAAFERVVNSGMLQGAELNERVKSLAQLYFRLKQYNKAADYAKRYLKTSPGDQETGILLGQAQYLLKDFKGAIQTMNSVITASERAGQKPSENWLQIVLSSYHNLNDQDGLADTQRRIVRHYPTPENWISLLALEQRKQQPDRAKLNVYRLMFDVDALKEAEHIIDAAEIALDLGLPGEALKYLEAGFASKVLENDADKARNQRLLTNARKLVSTDKASLAQQAKEAQTAQSGQNDVALGEAYLSYGQFDEAIGALQRGLKKGSVKDEAEARLNLGIAYLKKNQVSEARNAFKAVPDSSEWSDVAELWLLRANRAS